MDFTRLTQTHDGATQITPSGLPLEGRKPGHILNTPELSVVRCRKCPLFSLLGFYASLFCVASNEGLDGYDRLVDWGQPVGGFGSFDRPDHVCRPTPEHHTHPAIKPGVQES